MARKKEHLFDYLDKKNIEILDLMRRYHTYSELIRESGLTPSNFSARINRLIELKLVEIVYDMRRRRPKYMLTPVGEKVLELFKEVERIYKQEVEVATVG